MKIIPTLAALFLNLSSAAFSEPNNWYLVHESPNLRVNAREYAGSSLNEIRGVLRVRASSSAGVALLRDADFNHRWVYRSGGARIVSHEGDNRIYVHGVIDAPAPMRDRDAVVRFDLEEFPDTGRIVISIKNFPDFIARDDRYVRVPGFGGFWQLQPQENGWLEVTYQVYGDPGGWVPHWLANYAAQLSVTQTLKNMAEVIGRYERDRSPGRRPSQESVVPSATGSSPL